jgi:diacylglycerol kinase family enzyme
MSEPVPVIVNRGGGTAASRGDRLGAEIEAAFEEAGVVIDLHLVEGDKLESTLRAVADRPLLVVGGGDGTLGRMAGLLAEKGTTLGILPLGTRNHLARELGIPLDLPGAAALIAVGTVRAIDLARINGAPFINNASIGLYPQLVREREQRSTPKWIAAIPASLAALRRIKHHRLHLALPGDGKDSDIVTPMLFVGNNHYALEAGQIGRRDALDKGVLSIYAVASRRRLALVGFAIRTLFGRADRHDFAALGDTPEFEVRGRSDDIDIALDGEVMTLDMPLRFACEPGALNVVAPSGEAAMVR